jgi:hypothetical protein
MNLKAMIWYSRLVPLLFLATGFVSSAEIDPLDFGAVGDGVADDGPAIHRAVETLRKSVGPVTLRLENGWTYRIESSPDTRFFTLSGLRAFTLDGTRRSRDGPLRTIGLRLSRRKAVWPTGNCFDFPLMAKGQYQCPV